MPEKVVLILGAGATIADAMSKRPNNRPPLDRGFFAAARAASGKDLSDVERYMGKHYGGDLRVPELDSLERVIAVLYTDIFGGDLSTEAFTAFRQLVKVFLKRLAITTNSVPMTLRSRLYRIIAGIINSGVTPEDLTVVTFNQDLQIEKALTRLSATKGRAGHKVFHFPNCYRVEFEQVTAPTGGTHPLFESPTEDFPGVAVLKLHGSMNWYSRHNTRNPSRNALFNTSRLIRLTRRRAIDPDMTFNVAPGKRSKFTFPIIVPPVVHKSGILHESLKPLWELAKVQLHAADRIVIFGYSCPANDWESANLVASALSSNRTAIVELIDIDPSVVVRYARLGNLDGLSFFSSADAYLSAPV